MISGAALLLMGVGTQCAGPQVEAAAYPPEIQRALSRMPHMPKRIREKEVFAYLGLPRPAQGAEGEELLDTDHAPLPPSPYHWWRRYRIGADFALECHLETHRRDASLDEGTLTSSVIQSIKVDRDGKAHYVDLRPYYDRDGVIEGYHRSHMDRSDWNAP